MFLLLFLFLSLCGCKIEHMSLLSDTRPLFLVEHFGFLPHGTLNLTITNIAIAAQGDQKVGVLVRRGAHEVPVNAIAQRVRGTGKCVLDVPEPAAEVVYVLPTASPAGPASAAPAPFVISSEEASGGFLQVFFVNCGPRPVSLDLSLVQSNPGPDYLPAGDSPLPEVYALAAAVFSAALCLWVRELVRHRPFALTVHYLMTALMVFKVLSLVMDWQMLRYIRAHGHASGWDVAFFVFQSLKGIMRFLVILLVGTGYSLFKPYLSDAEKKVLLAVIPLQVVANIAAVVMDETMPGSLGWGKWTDALHFLDIVCCIAVLVPIGWSIRQLQEAASVDGQAARSMSKLKLFRQFYTAVFVYVYFTRIIVYMFRISLSYQTTYLSSVFQELAALAFYTYTGIKFGPTDRSYFLVPSDQQEYGDVDEEMGSMRVVEADL
jgi:hypothetical protein